MTPLEFAQRLSDHGNHADRVLAVAIVTRGLTDDDGVRMPWELDDLAVHWAAVYLKLDITPEFTKEVLALAPTLGDGILNKGAAR